MAKAKYSYNETRKEWSTKIWDGTFTPDGKKRRKTLSSKKSSADLERKVNEFKEQMKDNKGLVFSNYMFLEYAYHWLEVAKSAKEKNTQAMYQNVIRVHFDFLADVPLTEIRHSHFQQAINNQLDHPRTCKNIDITFKQVIKMAIRDRILPKSAYDDICLDISLPTYQKTEKRPLTDVEKQAVKAVELDEKKMAFLMLLYFCGLRRGEALALTRFDFDFKNKRVNITKNLIFVNGIPEIKPYPKSHNGVRKVPMPDELVKKIQKFVESSDGGPLFTMRNGQLMTKSSYDRMWESILTALNQAVGYNPWSRNRGLPPIQDLTAHIFRHNYCTELCYRIPELSTKMIAKMLGDSEKMVLEVYSHIVDEKEDVFDVINSTLSLAK